MLGKVLGAIILSLIGSIIYFFVEKGFLDTHFFRSDPISAVEQARINALTAEAVRQQEAAAKAQAEAEADRLRRQELERETQTRQQQLESERHRAQIQADIEAQQARQRATQQAQEEALAYQRRSQQQAQAAAEQQTRRAAAFRAANGGCNPGSHRVCVHVGPPAGGYNAGCYCHSD